MKKTIAIVMLVVLVSAVSVLGTLAYLTASDSVQNTFTVGKVAITLDEAKVDANGAALTGDAAVRVKANSYKLLPGHTYAKDPTIHVEAGSEDCYIRATVTISNGAAWAGIVKKYCDNDISKIVTGMDEDLWYVYNSQLDAATGKLVITMIYKNESKDESLKRVWQQGDGNDLVLFTNIVIPGALTNEEIAAVNDTKIEIKAYAIQADGFANEAEAWAAYPAE